MKVRVDKTGTQAAWRFARPKKKNRGGRPKFTDRRASEAHRVRPPLRADRPVHVTMRMVKSIRTMRTERVYNAIRRAMALAAVNERIRIVHFSIQRDHLHAIIEAHDRDELAKGMQGFQISAARQINRACGRDGQVFADRYHAVQETAPKMARNAIAYVLNNWRKHGERRGRYAGYRIDPYSSAISFDGWSNYDAVAARSRLPTAYVPLPVVEPSTWLLRVGWRRHGLIGIHEVPGESVRRARARAGARAGARA